MDRSIKVATLYLASLQALSIINRISHWTTKGSTFFGDHLLLDKIYNSASENLDAAAEKFVGVFGDECLAYQTHNELLGKVLDKYKGFEGKPLQMSLAAEKDFLAFSAAAVKVWEAEDTMSLGMSDLIPQIASDRESSMYFLSQALADDE